jgi:hypothetical protein
MAEGRIMKSLMIVGVVLLLSACGASTVVVQGSYPQPNIPAMPLTLGVYYGEGLMGFRYTEYSDRERPEYIVDSGRSHVELFSTILPTMFDSVVVLDSLESAGSAGVDAVFVPRIDEFQLAMPQKTRLDVYEVWIKYNMRLTSPNGGAIADWVMTAYGKVPQETLRSSERSINDATVAALRDLGSSFTLGFTAVPDVRDWLVAQGPR